MAEKERRLIFFCLPGELMVVPTFGKTATNELSNLGICENVDSEREGDRVPGTLHRIHVERDVQTWTVDEECGEREREHDGTVHVIVAKTVTE